MTLKPGQQITFQGKPCTVLSFRKKDGYHINLDYGDHTESWTFMAKETLQRKVLIPEKVEKKTPKRV